ncbi:LLM class flavin-dependent oxidoreductase [Amycolatopsis ultiminotia]|uniref:LLM class flavin-dependent oxidoreductase n=1 Tax=Amycolatopsis ultiminotia TaxID=543629 RepID=A0ABP6XBE7_9PSEU
MDIGIGLPTTVPGVQRGELLEFARRADRGGFRTLATIDRLVYDSYDCLVALSAAAAVTERVRLATTVLIAASRTGPVELAKQLATIDLLSGGRLVVGLASGGRPEDFVATGTDFHTRGSRLDAMIEGLRRHWDGADGGVGPRPANRIPLWVGGHSNAAMRRAARYADAWIAPGGTNRRFPDLLARAERQFAGVGRAERPRVVSLVYYALGGDEHVRGVEYLRHYYGHLVKDPAQIERKVLGDAGRIRETAAQYADAGCDELIFVPCTGDPEQVERLAGVVLP